MKKVILILVLGLLFSGRAYALSQYLAEFTQWLSDNGYSEYVGAKPDWSKCSGDKTASFDYIPLFCYGKDGKLLSENERKIIDKEWKKNKLDIKFYKSSEIPWGANPNKDTLIYYLFRYLENGYDRAGSKGSKNHYKFSTKLRDDKISKYIKKHMQKTALLSYLLFEDGKITIDEISPEDRFGILYNDDTQFTSASVGKSIVSYVTGHAICNGYISGIDHRLNDWPLLENTLFYDQKLINLLNMATGHQEYADSNLKTNKYEKNANANTVEFHMKKGVFKNSKKAKNKYQYTNLLSNILINYVWFKSEGKFQNLLDEIFIDKAKVKNDVWFLKMNDRTVKANNRNNTILKEYKVRDEDGPLRYSFRASRYDYLRIAKAILDDWQNDTCVGKYLKNIHERRIPKNDKLKDTKSSFFNPTAYAGFFHTNYSGMKKRAVLGMDGFGGQQIIIDFDLGRIVVINSVHWGYNWKKIAHSVIKKGK